ncbi:MAG: carbon-nitrogen hydrolase family protein [Thermodesulfobacteriota bacterium]
MKDTVRISLIQMASEQAVYNPGNRDINVEKIIGHLEDEGRGTDLLVFPELAITGYVPLRGYLPELKSRFWGVSEDARNSPALKRIQNVVSELETVCVVGFSERSLVKYETYNSAGLFEPSRPMRVVRKMHIPTEENHYFTPGSSVEVFETKIGRLGIAICYDFLFPEMIRILALKGAEMIIIIANVLDFGNFRTMNHVIPIARAIENQVHVIFCNGCTAFKTGKHEMRLLGDSKAINSLGEIVAQADHEQECVVCGTLTEDQLRRGASFLSVFRERRPTSYGPLLEPLRGSWE